MTTNTQPDPIRPDPAPIGAGAVAAPPLTVAADDLDGVRHGPPGQAGPADNGGRFGVKPSLMAAIAIGYGGIWVAFFTPVLVTLQVQVHNLAAPGHAARDLSILLSISGVASILTNPVAGLISDRSTSRFGRRRPWILGWAVLGVIGIGIQGFAPDLVVLNIGSVIGQVGFAGAIAVAYATLPDFIPVRRRGAMSALLGVTQSISIVIGAVVGGQLITHIAAAYLVPAAIGLLAVLVLFVLLPDRQRSVEEAGSAIRITARQVVSSYWVDPRVHRDFGWAWISRFTAYLGFAATNNYLVYYLSGQLGLTTRQAAATVGTCIALTSLFVVLSSVVFGPLSDRIGRRKPLVAVSALIGLGGLVCYAFATSLPLVFVASAIMGIAQGAYAAVDLALVTEVLPDSARSAGRHLGVIAISNQLPQTLSPAFAPLLLAISFGSVVGARAGDNYTMLFLGSAISVGISAVTVFRVRSVR